MKKSPKISPKIKTFILLIVGVFLISVFILRWGQKERQSEPLYESTPTSTSKIIDDFVGQQQPDTEWEEWLSNFDFSTLQMPNFAQEQEPVVDKFALEIDPRSLIMDTGVDLFQDAFGNILYYRSAPSGAGPLGWLFLVGETEDKETTLSLCESAKQQIQEDIPLNKNLEYRFCDEYTRYLLQGDGLTPLTRIDPTIQNFEIVTYDFGLEEVWKVVGLLPNGTEFFSEFTSGEPEYLNIYVDPNDDENLYVVFGRSGPAWEGDSTGEQLIVTSGVDVNSEIIYPPHTKHGRSELMTKGQIILSEGEIAPRVITKNLEEEVEVIEYTNYELGVRFKYPAELGSVQKRLRPHNGYQGCDNEAVLHFPEFDSNFWIGPYSKYCAESITEKAPREKAVVRFDENFFNKEDYFQYYGQGTQSGVKTAFPNTDVSAKQSGVIFNSKRAAFSSYAVVNNNDVYSRIILATFETLPGGMLNGDPVVMEKNTPFYYVDILESDQYSDVELVTDEYWGALYSKARQVSEQTLEGYFMEYYDSGDISQNSQHPVLRPFQDRVIVAVDAVETDEVIKVNFNIPSAFGMHLSIATRDAWLSEIYSHIKNPQNKKICSYTNGVDIKYFDDQSDDINKMSKDYGRPECF